MQVKVLLHMSRDNLQLISSDQSIRGWVCWHT